ncbi:MAG: UDP-N-acetylmuramate dehydrogenase [Lewinellaceae bacterium]|nr:UDP-N-acetylmuramate dehydrogenase [Phaeodactylibacter sp.]MCB9351834.1 UDP-N-acetylmuramate dehydrogenase [Lewinellaceae bacterium]
MKIRENVSLKPYNTFGVEATAPHFVEIHSTEELQQILRQWQGGKPFILGGGSNILLAGEMRRLVIKNSIKEKAITARKGDKAWVSAGGGENWHEFVRWCLEHELGGIENLSLIPGTAGAAPIQNIGAYGCELSEVFHMLEAVELDTGALHSFGREACRFGYRDSIFKQELKGQYCITRVSLELSTAHHQLNTSYGAIRQMLAGQGIGAPTIHDVSRAVVAIRSSKLPDPEVLGNSGSFFKNPELPYRQFEGLQQEYKDMPYYPLDNGGVKLPAGWLIEQAGWKGKRLGDAGCYEKQALVLVNHGKASGRDIFELAQRIQDDVQEKFGIWLEMEVNVV